MARPRISVVLATNRDSPFLPESLQSLTDQTWSDWELVVVDNGVPDQARLHELVGAVPRSRIVEATPWTLARSRNVGVAASVGDLLVFHDDDVWAPTRLERQVDALDAAPGAVASSVGGWHLDEHGRRIGAGFPARAASAEAILAGRSPTPHICGALMVRREAHLEAGGFAPELSIMEDFEYMLRLLMLGELACVPEELLGYRRHSENMTSTDLGNYRLRRHVMDESLERLRWSAEARGDARTQALLAEHRDRFRSEAAVVAGGDVVRLLRRGNLRDAVGELAWGVRAGPRRVVSGAWRRVVRR